jgi:hypothetical protein
VPRVELHGVCGNMLRIDTTSRELLQAWFDEWLPLLYPDPRLGDPVIQCVYPLQAADGAWDWPGDTRFTGQPFRIPRDPAKALAALDTQREWIEDRMRDERGAAWLP